MTALTLTLANILQNPLSELVKTISDLLTKIQRFRQEQQAINELSALSDYHLRDMGISRGEIRSVVRGDKDLYRSCDTNENLRGFV